MLPPPIEERAEYLVRLLSEMKDRWGWKISILSPGGGAAAFKKLTEPTGQVFVTPDYRVVADWESDAASMARVEERLREAERVTGVPVGQFLLAAQANIGCAFALPHLRRKPNAVTALMLGDNAEPHRAYRRLFGFADTLLEQAKPDVVLAYEWEKPWRSNVWMAATRRKIPCFAIRRSKLNGDHYFWTVDRTLFNAEASQLARVKVETNANVSDAARRRIASFRDTPKTVKYIGEKWDLYGNRTWLRWHKEWVRVFLKRTMLKAKGRRKAGKSSFRQAFEYNRRIVEGKRDKTYFSSFDEPELAQMKYIYFPMHKETDEPLVFKAPRWHDQRNTITVLAASLPLGYRLLAREHRFNVGMRPKHYYEWLSKLPNLVLINPFDDQFKYIRNASLLVTENGSSGWEGLMLKRPVIALSRTAYDGASLAQKVPNADELGAEVLKALSEPVVGDAEEYDRRLGCMLDAEFETTFSMSLDRVSEGAERLEAMLSEWLLKEQRLALS